MTAYDILSITNKFLFRRLDNRDTVTVHAWMTNANSVLLTPVKIQYKDDGKNWEFKRDIGQNAKFSAIDFSLLIFLTACLSLHYSFFLFPCFWLKAFYFPILFIQFLC